MEFVSEDILKGIALSAFYTSYVAQKWKNVTSTVFSCGTSCNC